MFGALVMIVVTTCVEAFSSAAPPSSMSRKEQWRDMNSIWHYTQRDHQDPEKALKLLAKLLQEEKDNGGKMLKKGAVWNVFRSCRRLQEPLSDSCVTSLESSLALLEKNSRLYQYNMTEYSVTLLSDRPERAQALMNRHSQSLLNTTTWSDSVLLSAKNAIWFHIHKNENRQEGAEMALLLLERLLEQDDQQQVVSKGMIFNVLRNGQEHPSFSFHTLERLLPLLEQGKLLDAKIFNEVLMTMTKCRDGNAVARAEAILKGFSFMPPNTFHYCTVLNGHAKRGDAKKAEALLQSMTDQNILLNTVVFNCVLDAFSKSKETKVVERAEQVLKRMNDRTRPDMVSYTSMWNLYSKQAMGIKAEELLEHVLQLQDSGKLKRGPTDLNFRCVIDALAKSGHADRAERLLRRMRERNVVPNKFHYCGVLNGYAREGRPLEAERLLTEMQKHDNVTPNDVAYNCAMYAWTKSGQVDAPFRAKALADRMIEAGVEPNVITYNCLLGACANRSMVNESEKLLKKMHELHDAGKICDPPNTISYNYVLDSLARSGDRVWTVLRAETLVDRMKDLDEAGVPDIKPNMISYRSLLRCYANWNLSQDAEQLLHRMQELHDKGDLEYGPDRVSYRVVIDALGKAEEEDARNRASELKKQIEDKYGENTWKQETVIDVVDQMDALLEYMST
jgi:pentatricopeptide repeat protein